MSAVRWPTRALQQEEEEEAVPGAESTLLPPDTKVLQLHARPITEASYYSLVIPQCCPLGLPVSHQLLIMNAAFLRNVRLTRWVFCFAVEQLWNRPCQATAFGGWSILTSNHSDTHVQASS